MANNPATAVPSWTPLPQANLEAYNFKSKQLAKMEIPGIFYNQYTPTAANCNTGTVTSNGASMIGANQIGVAQGGTAPLGVVTIVTIATTGLVTISTAAAWLPTNNYNNMPVTLSVSTSGVLPLGLFANTIYYWQWVTSTTGNLALTPGGTTVAPTTTGTATIYLSAATQYYGSPIIPAGFLQAAEALGQIQGNTSAFPGVAIRGEIAGSITSAGTGNIQMAAGVYNAAGTWTALTGAAANVALAAVGPFPFWYTFEFIVQQYGPASVSGQYANIAQVRGWGRFIGAQAATSGTADITSTNIWASTTSLDLTQQYTIDARALLGTPATGTYIEPLTVRLWAIN